MDDRARLHDRGLHRDVETALLADLHELDVDASGTAEHLLRTQREQCGVLRLDPVSGRLDDTNFEARFVPAERFVRAELDRIDLNRYLPPAAKAAPTNGTAGKKATLEAAVAELAKLDIDAEIRVEEARVAGATLRDAVIRVERGEAAP